MRTLLIDNYDSFTYNLFHLLAGVVGSEPVVVRNDERGWRDSWLAEFDLVVVSAGPGHPQVARDMGLSRRVLCEARLVRPLLGVCLGFQGLCLEAGARVELAPEPVHGRVEEVLHDGRGLFAGLREPLRVVRYHSLCVRALPAVLHLSAWTRSGLPMAVAHRDRPAYGVQFHPESACSEQGEQLLRNFCELGERWLHRAGVSAASRPVASRSAAKAEPETAASGPKVRQYGLFSRELVLPPAVATDTERLFVCEYGQAPMAFWLDSNSPGAEASELSVMGGADGPRGRWVSANVAQQTVSVQHVGGAVVAGAQAKESVDHLERQSFFEWLRSDLARISVEEAPGLPFAVRPGWFGYLGYELKAECGAVGGAGGEHPDASLIFADRIVVVDHRRGGVYALALVGTAKERVAAEAWAQRLQERFEGCQGRGAAEGSSLESVAVPAPVALPRGRGLQLRHGPREYLQLIAACQEEIRRGESYELCLTNRLDFELETNVDALDVYRRLRRDNPTSFSAFLRLPGVSVASFSPERFLRVQQGVAESRPIKGTWPRESDPRVDAERRRALARSPKEQAENLMVVDLVRHDLGRCAVPGGVAVPALFAVETYATVHQLVSTVRAVLRPEVTAVDCMQAAFPGGSMTGAPKVRTLEILDRLEQGPRGIYSGGIGYFGVNGAADWSMVIRTLLCSGKRLSLGCGGAIIAASDPQLELAETALKSRALLEPFGLRWPLVGDSMLDPLKGIP